jgi:hypothetical protein
MGIFGKNGNMITLCQSFFLHPHSKCADAIVILFIGDWLFKSHTDRSQVTELAPARVDDVVQGHSDIWPIHHGALPH